MLAIGRKARIRSNRSLGRTESTETTVASLLPSSLSSKNESYPLTPETYQTLNQNPRNQSTIKPNPRNTPPPPPNQKPQTPNQKPQIGTKVMSTKRRSAPPNQNQGLDERERERERIRLGFLEFWVLLWWW